VLLKSKIIYSYDWKYWCIHVVCQVKGHTRKLTTRTANSNRRIAWIPSRGSHNCDWSNLLIYFTFEMILLHIQKKGAVWHCITTLFDENFQDRGKCVIHSFHVLLLHFHSHSNHVVLRIVKFILDMTSPIILIHMLCTYHHLSKHHSSWEVHINRFKG